MDFINANQLNSKRIMKEYEESLDACKLTDWQNEMLKKEAQCIPKKSECDVISEYLKSISVEDSNKSTKEMSNNKEVKKKKAMTYADWDKFDADKECKKVDHDSESSSGSLQEVLEEQAAIEKQQGNQYVKQGKWNDAIRCYTNAIKYYEYDPIFYANRGLCYMKINEMKKAERDCSIAITLDNTYVKAYLRRAAAREALNDLVGAEADLQRVLILEPKNSEAKKRFQEVEMKAKGLLQSPTSTAEKLAQDCSSLAPMQSVAQLTSTKIDVHNPSFLWPSGEVDNIIRAIKKPPHMISKKPLTRIPIQEINTVLTELSESPEDDRKSKTKFTLKTEDSKIVEQPKPEITETKKPERKEKNFVRPEFTKIEYKMMEGDPDSVVPRTALGFFADWKELKGKDDVRANYLNMISPEKIPSIFKSFLESEVLSEILKVMADQFPQKGYNTFEYMLHLSNIKRFSALKMFLTLEDHENIRRIFDHCKKSELYSEDEIDALSYKFEF